MQAGAREWPKLGGKERDREGSAEIVKHSHHIDLDYSMQ
jgi:hypothetical protein